MEKFEKNGENSGYCVHESAKGWIVEGWSRYQGSRTGWKKLVPYGVWGYQKGQDLTAIHNKTYGVNVGEAIQDYARIDNADVKVIRHGILVQ